MTIQVLRWSPAATAIAWLAPLALLAAAGGEARGASPLQDCAYASEPAGDLVTHEACASISDGGALRLAPARLRELRFDEDGLAAVQVGRLFFYVASDGRSSPVAGVDGEAAGFHNGLAPSPRLMDSGGYKIGYIDKQLKLVIPARFDGGLDFNEGRAQVCLGCKVARDGEMAELQGGVWGCIDTLGREVVPVTQASPDNLDCSTAKANQSSVR
jgi:WG repeat protein